MPHKGEIYAAITAHAQWKHHIWEAIEEGTSEFEVSVVQRDDQCQFGKWLHKDVESEERESSQYQIIKQVHAEFHGEAARVLDLALQGHKDEALLAMSEDGQFLKLSAALISAMMKGRDSLSENED